MNDPAASANAGERLAHGPDVLGINVEGEIVVFHMPGGRYYGLRGAAGLIWEKIEGGTDRESDIVQQIVAEYRGDPEHIRADIGKAIAEMKRSGLLVAG